jgi:hypothetical protein
MSPAKFLFMFCTYIERFSFDSFIVQPLLHVQPFLNSGSVCGHGTHRLRHLSPLVARPAINDVMRMENRMLSREGRLLRRVGVYRIPGFY